ncbi:hypothetical protein BS47DRAFT_306521 [Hydnum rufescens UP504]|uniref:DUF7918 domain-containing protein n=1 Tax=Hydnum rufescens UP504 TaxID=1448309 RepID=A0A9P6AMH6_9AGAM|nr:hypothetical protein BS47DRAFT_306521 [Hydnum rufescens UP504]
MVRAPGTGFQFRILCEGEYLPEYSVVAEGNRVTCWVASKEGKAFEIGVQPEFTPYPPERMLRIAIYFDGSNESAGRYTVSSTPVRTSALARIDRITTEGGIERQFCFSKLKLLENDGSTQLSENQIKLLGTIHLRLNHVRRVGPYYYAAQVASQRAIAPPALNERSKKGGGHVISLGAQLGPSTARPTFATGLVPNMPSLDILFHYAPKELLIAREIIPRPPSLPPVIKQATGHAAAKRGREETDDDDASALTDEEDAAAYARLRAKIAAKKRVKITSVKSEPSEISTRMFKKGEIIDISD